MRDASTRLASAIGLRIALSSRAEVVVINGGGALLATAQAARAVQPGPGQHGIGAAMLRQHNRRRWLGGANVWPRRSVNLMCRWRVLCVCLRTSGRSVAPLYEITIGCHGPSYGFVI